MNAPTTPTATAPALKPLHAFIAGRCTQVRKAGNTFLHLVVLPAPDEYSSPSTVEILASKRFADTGQDVRVQVRIGGFRRQYKSVDKDTGEMRQTTTADNKLFAVLPE